MTVHFYTKEPIERPSSRLRAFIVAEELNKRGVRAVVHSPAVETISETPWPKKGVLLWRIVRSLGAVKKGDVLLMHRTVGNKYFFALMVVYVWVTRRKMIFDFDDAIYKHSGFKTRVFTKIASAVFVCSVVLRDWALQYNPNVHIFHTTFDTGRYKDHLKRYTQSQQPPLLGWVGRGEEHVENLKLIAGVLRRLQANKVPFRFLLIGAWKDKRIHELFKDIPTAELVDFIDWQDTPQAVSQFDIALAPLVEKSVWNRSRSVGKLFEYLIIGIASVSSRNGEPTNVITNGVDGYLADGEEEWTAVLEHLIKDKTLQARVGKAGHEMFLKRESFDAIVPRIIDIIKNL